MLTSKQHLPGTSLLSGFQSALQLCQRDWCFKARLSMSCWLWYQEISSHLVDYPWFPAHAICLGHNQGCQIFTSLLGVANSPNFEHYIPDSKIHGDNVGPTWGRQDPGGPHVGHMNFAIWDAHTNTDTGSKTKLYYQYSKLQFWTSQVCMLLTNCIIYWSNPGHLIG